MLEVGALVFAAPAALAALALLPLIWWLLKISPPAPHRLRFPAIRFLLGLQPPEETPHRIPWWLLLLRFALAALIILALAHPLIDARDRLGPGEAVILVVDDGWAAASRWDERRAALDEIVDQAERAGRTVALVTTAAPRSGDAARISLERATDARRRIGALEPKPWGTDRPTALGRLEALDLDRPASVIWLADGTAAEGDRRFAEQLQRLGALTILTDPPESGAYVLRPPRRHGNTLELRVERPAATGPAVARVRAVAVDGRTLARRELAFDADAIRAEASLEVPSEVLNEIVALRIEARAGAAETVLLDEGWRRRPVGIVDAGPGMIGHPLLDNRHYIKSALGPFSDVREGSLDELIQRRTAVIVLTDATESTQELRSTAAEWVEQGGVLVRFAGESLAETPDELLPVALRRGGRALGGAMSWSEPQPLSPFPEHGPFAGLGVPEEVTVVRQVLAEPSLDLRRKTWAALEDGTPLVTAEQRGQGWVVLMHTSANADWSNLSLSGLFVRMLERLVGLSRGVVDGETTDGTLYPVELLDGFGRLTSPDHAARPIEAGNLDTVGIGPSHPPGYYGTEGNRRAVNLSANLPAPEPLARMPSGVMQESFGGEAAFDLKPWLLTAALILALADLLIALWLRGYFSRWRRVPATAAMALLALGGLGAGDAHADERFALDATLETRLAYVRTGDPEVDRISEAGLSGLSAVLTQRTSVEPKDPMGVDIEVSELAFFPFLYWPITPDHPDISRDARTRVAEFLRNGGTILFDTRDAAEVGSGIGVSGEATTPARDRLRRILAGVRIPPLKPVPPDHVLTKAFYLIQEFPGRWSGGPLWIEQVSATHNDGVSPVMIGGNDWAAAWAADDLGRPMFPVMPGGERQREIAYRFGVNLVMHVLTGNYKADQVHVPTILQRLGE